LDLSIVLEITEGALTAEIITAVDVQAPRTGARGVGACG